MAVKPTNIDTSAQLERNLALLQAGSLVTIDVVTPTGQRGKFRTTFIGYLPKQYILIQFPENNKLGKFAEYIVPSSSITVRGLIEGHEGAVVAFISTIKQTMQIPSRIIVLEFPSTVNLQNLRSSVRIATDINAKVKIEGSFWKATIANLSIHGCQLSMVNNEKLALSETTTIDIIVADNEGGNNIKLLGAVCNLKQQTEALSFGVKFNEASHDQVSQLLLNSISS